MAGALPALQGFVSHSEGSGQLYSMVDVCSGCFMESGLWGASLEVGRPVRRLIPVQRREGGA